MTAARIWWRLARSQPGLLAIATVVVALACGLLATGARVFHEVAADDLVHAIDEGPEPAQRIEYVVESRLGIGPDDPMAQIRARGEAFLDERVSDVVADVLEPSQFVIDSPPYEISSFPDEDDGPFELSIALRYQQGLESQMSLIAGELPQNSSAVDVLRGTECPADRLELAGYVHDPLIDCEVHQLGVHQVALTEESARDLLVGVGDRIMLHPEILDPLWAPVFGVDLSEPTVLEISGLIELSSPDAPFWFGDTTLHRPVVTENADFRIVEAIGFLAPAQYRSWLRERLGVRWRYTWRYPVAADRIPVDGAAEVANEVSQLSAPDGRVISRLDAAIFAHLDQRALALAVASISSSGVVTLAVAAVWIIVALAGRREARGWRTLESRGAGRSTMATIGVLHGLAVTIPAVLATSLVAWAVAPNAPWTPAGTLLVALAVLVIGTTTTATLRNDARLGVSSGALTSSTSTSARRLVRDALLVVLAIGAVVLASRRDATGGLDRSGGLDLLLALTPPAVAMALAAITIRFAPRLFEIVSTIGARFDGLVGFVGSRRLASGRSAAGASAVIVVLAIGVAGLAGSLRRSLPAIDRSDPFPLWIERGLEVLIAYSILIAFVGVSAGLAMTAASRRRALSILHTLGASSREMAGITSLGQVASTLLAAVVGVIAAVVAVIGVGSALDFAVFAANDSGIEQAPVRLDRTSAVASGSAVILASVVGAMVAIRLDRRSVEMSSLDKGGVG
ncbi:MAG: hypothetical protein ACR2P0_06350 [Acidimicrobiales bacterium]